MVINKEAILELSLPMVVKPATAGQPLLVMLNKVGSESRFAGCLFLTRVLQVIPKVVVISKVATSKVATSNLATNNNRATLVVAINAPPSLRRELPSRLSA